MTTWWSRSDSWPTLLAGAGSSSRSNVGGESHEHINRKFFDNEVPPRTKNGYAASDAFGPDIIDHHQLAEFYETEIGDLFLGPGDL